MRKSGLGVHISLMTDQQAETFALQSLAWLASDAEMLDGFMAQSGVGRDELRARASDRDLLSGVMAFLLSADERILAAAAALSVPPETLAAAARHLSGELPHWT